MRAKRIAITGGIACGKSTVAAMLHDFGGEILDTDNVAHQLQESGGAAVAAIAQAFGDVVVAEDGSVDRKILAPLVFASRDALTRLNAIMHPMIADLMRTWLDRETDAPFKAVLVPLLYEAKLDAAYEWDAVVAVVCNADEQIRRLRGRGHSLRDAQARIAAQMPCEIKARKADYIIQNNSTLESLRRRVTEVVGRVLSESGNEARI